MANVHVEWGERALDHNADVAVIVDCLSFSTALCVACARGAKVFPFDLREGAKRFASLLELEIAGKRREKGLSLSPPSLNQLKPGAQIILPSPNGSNLTLFAKQNHVFAGSLRNAKACASAIEQVGQDVIIVAAGERWQTDNSLRPAFEDWITAGVIASYLGDGFDLSTEAKLAVSSFRAVENDLHNSLIDCQSGQELTERGFVEDVEWAAKLDATPVVPKLVWRQQSYADIGLSGDDVPTPSVLTMPVCYYEAI